MEKVAYDLDTSGGVMEEIQLLITPPQSDETKRRQAAKEAALYRRLPRAVNRDSCDACKEGGDLLCCDQCSSSFHLQCCDPPLEDEDVPTGEWVCIECKNGVTKKSDLKPQPAFSSSMSDKSFSSRSSSPVDSELDMNPFERLTALYRNKNPTEFQLPASMQDYTVMPGDRKRNRTAAQAKKKEEEAQRLCFVCSKSSRVDYMINCDFCPLVYHRDCLMPPLAQDPIGLWLCPGHPENFEPNLRTPRYSQRAEILEELRTNISHNTVKLHFFKKAKKERILMNRLNHQPKRRRTCVVPEIVKAQYANPPAVVVPDILPEVNRPLQPHMRPFTLPTSREKEQWLKTVIDLQCSIAASLEKPKVIAPLPTTKSSPKKISVASSSTSSTQSSSSQSASTSTSTSNASSTQITKSTPSLKSSSEGVAKGESDPVEQTGAEQGQVTQKELDDNPVQNSEESVKATPVSETPSPMEVDIEPAVVTPVINKSNKNLSPSDSTTSLPEKTSETTAASPKIIILANQTTVSSSSSTMNVALSTTVAEKKTSTAKTSALVEPSSSGKSSTNMTPKVATVSSTGGHMVSSISTEILKDPTLSQLDDRLIRILAFQRLQQLVEKKSQQIPKISKPGITEKKIIVQATETKNAIAVLSPLNGLSPACYMRYKTFNAGQGADMDLCLSKYGFCNYISGKHATIFFDKESRQFELLNYSEHGTIVDNVLYSCDFSEKPKPNVTSSTAKYDNNSSYLDPQQGKKKPPIGRTTRGLGTEFITRGCNCRASASSLIGGSGAGWEGTAVLHHGSYVKFGCLHFVFSIVDCATNASSLLLQSNQSANRTVNKVKVQAPVKKESIITTVS